MRRPDRRAHFRQHFNEAVNGVRRRSRRRAQFADRVKRAICAGVSVNNQQPFHKNNPRIFFKGPSSTKINPAHLSSDSVEGVPTKGGAIGFTVWVVCPASGGCGGMVAGLKGSSSSEWTRLPAGSTIVAVTKIIRFFFMEDLDSL